MSRPQSSSVWKWPDTSSTPRPDASTASTCSAPAIVACRGNAPSGPHHARRNSMNPMPSERKFARTSRARAAASSAGNASATLRSA